MLLESLFTTKGAAALGAGIVAIGAGIGLVGAGIGLGKIGSSAMDAMARQPEAISKIQTPMIIIGALVEGVSLFAVVVCLLAS